jgi:phage/plasmid-associated DNA primase
MIVGNNKPSLRGVDEAIRRRLHLIPLTVTIPPAERDPNLLEKLKTEWPAILRWAIDGCLEMAEARPQSTGGRARRDEYLPCGRGYFRTVARRMHHA